MLPERNRRYDTVWRAATPYLRVRKNDVHVPIAFEFAQELLTHYPQADVDVCSLAILLHDCGWHVIDMVDIIEKGFGPNMMQSDVRFRHEEEGVRLAQEVLGATGWPKATIDAVCKIIDGHDTRKDPRSHDDSIVRDADKLWRFTVVGAAVAADWFKCTPQQYTLRQDVTLRLLETGAAPAIALREIEIAKRVLMSDLL